MLRSVTDRRFCGTMPAREMPLRRSPLETLAWDQSLIDSRIAIGPRGIMIPL